TLSCILIRRAVLCYRQYCLAARRGCVANAAGDSTSACDPGNADDAHLRAVQLPYQAALQAEDQSCVRCHRTSRCRKAPGCCLEESLRHLASPPASWRTSQPDLRDKY